MNTENEHRSAGKKNDAESLIQVNFLVYDFVLSIKIFFLSGPLSPDLTQCWKPSLPQFSAWSHVEYSSVQRWLLSYASQV